MANTAELKPIAKIGPRDQCLLYTVTLTVMAMTLLTAAGRVKPRVRAIATSLEFQRTALISILVGMISVFVMAFTSRNHWMNFYAYLILCVALSAIVFNKTQQVSSDLIAVLATLTASVIVIVCTRLGRIGMTSETIDNMERPLYIALGILVCASAVDVDSVGVQAFAEKYGVPVKLNLDDKAFKVICACAASAVFAIVAIVDANKFATGTQCEPHCCTRGVSLLYVSFTCLLFEIITLFEYFE